jgi:hypothetical protein
MEPQRNENYALQKMDSSWLAWQDSIQGNYNGVSSIAHNLLLHHFKINSKEPETWKFNIKVNINKKFWKELITYFLLIRTDRKENVRYRGNVVTELLPTNDRGIHRPIDSPLTRHGPHRKWRVQ